jgi:hypothetical protein
LTVDDISKKLNLEEREKLSGGGGEGGAGGGGWDGSKPGNKYITDTRCRVMWAGIPGLGKINLKPQHKPMLKGQCHEIFYFRFFYMDQFPTGP